MKIKKTILGILLSTMVLSSSVLAARPNPDWYEPNNSDVLNPSSHTTPIIGNITPKDQLAVVDPDHGFILSVSSPIQLHFAVYDSTAGNNTNTPDGTPIFSTPKYKMINRTGADVTVKIASVTERSISNNKYDLVDTTPTSPSQIKLSLDTSGNNSGFNGGVSTVIKENMSEAQIGTIPAATNLTGQEANFKLSAQLHSSLPSVKLTSQHDVVFKFEASPNGNVQRP